MINRIKARNISSIYSEIDISFQSRRYSYLESNVTNGIVNPTVLIGANGTGKSTFLKLFKNLMELTNRENVNSVIVPNYFINNGKTGPNEESYIEVGFTIDTVGYTYSILISPQIIDGNRVLKISKESLIADGKEQFLKGYDEESLGEITMLSKSAESNNDYLKKSYFFLSEIVFIGSDGNMYKKDGWRDNKSSFVKYSDKIFDAIEKYDLRILRPLKFENAQFANEEDLGVRLTENHDFSFKFDSRFFSKGTVKVYQLLARMFYVIEKRESGLIMTPKTFVIDELDNSYHNETLSKLTKIFTSHDLQLIFSTHKTNVLRNLRPDQIVLSSIENFGSKYSRGSDIEGIREVHNLEKIYLSGKLEE